MACEMPWVAQLGFQLALGCAAWAIALRAGRSGFYEALGLGPKNPIASNETDKGRQMNRRVEIELNLDNS